MEPTREQVIAEKYRLLALLDGAKNEEEYSIIINAVSDIDTWLLVH